MLLYTVRHPAQDAASSLLGRLQSKVVFRNTDQVLSGEKFRSLSLEEVDSSALEAVELELVRQGKIRVRLCNGRKVRPAICVCMSDKM